MPATLVKAREAEEVASADSLIEEVRALAKKARSLTAKAEESDDIRTALMGLREIARLLELRARVAGEIKATQVEVNIAALSIDQLTDHQADELERKLSARRIDRFIPPQEKAAMEARMEDAMITSMLYDPEKRQRVRERLAAFDSDQKPDGQA